MFSEYFGMRWNELIGTTIKRAGIYAFKGDVSTIYCGRLVLGGYTVYLPRIYTDLGRIILIRFRCCLAVARNCRYRGCGCRGRQRCLTFLRASAWSLRSSRLAARSPGRKHAPAWAV